MLNHIVQTTMRNHSLKVHALSLLARWDVWALIPNRVELSSVPHYSYVALTLRYGCGILGFLLHTAYPDDPLGWMPSKYLDPSQSGLSICSNQQDRVTRTQGFSEEDEHPINPQRWWAFFFLYEFKGSNIGPILSYHVWKVFIACLQEI